MHSSATRNFNNPSLSVTCMYYFLSPDRMPLHIFNSFSCSNHLIQSEFVSSMIKIFDTVVAPTLIRTHSLFLNANFTFLSIHLKFSRMCERVCTMVLITSNIRCVRMKFTRQWKYRPSAYASTHKRYSRRWAPTKRMRKLMWKHIVCDIIIIMFFFSTSF